MDPSIARLGRATRRGLRATQPCGDTIPQKHIRSLRARAQAGDPHAVYNLAREQRKAFATGFLTSFERDLEIAVLIALETEQFLEGVLHTPRVSTGRELHT